MRSADVSVRRSSGGYDQITRPVLATMSMTDEWQPRPLQWAARHQPRHLAQVPPAAPPLSRKSSKHCSFARATGDVAYFPRVEPGWSGATHEKFTTYRIDLEKEPHLEDLRDRSCWGKLRGMVQLVPRYPQYRTRFPPLSSAHSGRSRLEFRKMPPKFRPTSTSARRTTPQRFLVSS